MPEPLALNRLRAVVFGATGGIGSALVANLAGSARYGAIYAGARRFAGGMVRVDERISHFGFELAHEPSIQHAAALIGEGGPIDLVIVATGALHGADLPLPEKTWRAINGDAMARMFAINTIGPALIAKHVLPLLRRDRRTVFAVLSARVGSIADNRLGGWHSYRAAKAALNMLVRNFAIELAARNPQAIAVAVHPGTVDTPLSQPFQRGVPTTTLLPPDRSATDIMTTIDRLTTADSGGLFGRQGERIAY